MKNGLRYYFFKNYLFFVLLFVIIVSVMKNSIILFQIFFILGCNFIKRGTDQWGSFQIKKH